MYLLGGDFAPACKREEILSRSPLSSSHLCHSPDQISSPATVSRKKATSRGGGNLSCEGGRRPPSRARNTHMDRPPEEAHTDSAFTPPAGRRAGKCRYHLGQHTAEEGKWRGCPSCPEGGVLKALTCAAGGRREAALLVFWQRQKVLPLPLSKTHPCLKDPEIAMSVCCCKTVESPAAPSRLTIF